LWAGDKFDRRVRLLDADAVLDRTGDSYAFIRSAYLQRREFLVNDGITAGNDLEAELEKELEEDPPKEP
jgi:phospholipid-binding lipoprotein MlaA